jgi:putative transposase
MITTHGTSIEITEQLSPKAATAIAQWIGSYTVIYNQKTIASKTAYTNWISAGKPKELKPVNNAQSSFLNQEFEFLKDVPCQIRRNAGAKWFEAYSACLKGIRKHPAVRQKNKKRNCYVTNELFDVEAVDTDNCILHVKADGKKSGRGNYLFGLKLPFSKDKAGKALFLSRQGSRFWLSISHKVEISVPDEKTLIKMVAAMSDSELEEKVLGFDLGVKRQVTDSSGNYFHLTNQAQNSLKKIEAKRNKYQRRYARVTRANDRALGTNKRKRTKGELKLSSKFAKHSGKKANIHQNNSHHISKAIVASTPLVAVFENLKLDSMVRKPKAKLCPDTGVWLKNGASAKRGLNKAILSANMGQIRQFAEYKLKDSGKLFIKVKPHFSSQECSDCGNIDKENRKTQASFECQSCGMKMNADENAAKIIKKRGISLIRAEAFSKEKTVRTVKVRRKKAHELASSGSGDEVSLASVQANICDALNSIRPLA